MSEKELASHVKLITRNAAHLCFVESHLTSAGIPDIDFCISGVEGHLELKYWGKEPPNFRPTQIKWFRDRNSHGGVSIILTEYSKSSKHFYMFHDSTMVEDLQEHQGLIDHWRKTAYRVTDILDWWEFVDSVGGRTKLMRKITQQAELHRSGRLLS